MMSGTGGPVGESVGIGVVGVVGDCDGVRDGDDVCGDCDGVFDGPRDGVLLGPRDGVLLGA